MCVYACHSLRKVVAGRRGRKGEGARERGERVGTKQGQSDKVCEPEVRARHGCDQVSQHNADLALRHSELALCSGNSNSNSSGV